MKKYKEEKAKEIILKLTEEAKKLFNDGEYKKSGKLYSEIAKFIWNWKLNTVKDIDDTRRQERERDNKVDGVETKPEPEKT